MKSLLCIALLFGKMSVAIAAPLVFQLSGERDGSEVIMFGKKRLSKKEFKILLKRIHEDDVTNEKGDGVFVQITDKSGWLQLGEIGRIIWESGLGDFVVVVTSLKKED